MLREGWHRERRVSSLGVDNGFAGLWASENACGGSQAAEFHSFVSLLIHTCSVWTVGREKSDSDERLKERATPAFQVLARALRSLFHAQGSVGVSYFPRIPLLGSLLVTGQNRHNVTLLFQWCP